MTATMERRIAKPEHGGYTERSEVAYRRGFGIDARAGGRRYADHAGAGLVEAWRAYRAEDSPIWQGSMGIHRPERDFLAADE